MGATLPRPSDVVRASVIIPTYQAGVTAVGELEARLRQQTLPPFEVIVVDSSSTDGSFEAWSADVKRHQIPKREFNHGRTRNLGAALASGDILVFMTQDALPADERWLEELTRPIVSAQAGAAYSRQLPKVDAAPTERFARLTNYPPEAEIRCSDSPGTAIRRNFFSNVSSAVNARYFHMIRGFPEDVILSEDVVLAARLLADGRCIAYAAESQVLHSHSYSLAQQFQRYFDIGVALKKGGPELADQGTQRAGVSYVIQQLRYLMREREYGAIPFAIVESAAKWTGYRLGRIERLLPTAVKRRLSMHAAFWDRPAA